uniref:PGAP2-interacting protein n=1 Tax=Phallusia mammillata TaxID=59560 RepID=A0A6F9D9N2_9ASCI|nr:PGAP2-interacting protein [Phallusia mammillata]
MNGSSISNFISLFRESCIGYAFWCLVHGLGPMIWFYPLNELDVTGYEAFVVVAFSPVLFICRGTINEIFGSHGAIQLYLVLMLGGCASFHAPSTLSRLVGLSFGVAAAFLMQASTWWSEDEQERKLAFWGHTIGFIALLSSRVWYVSITPMWNDQMTNKIIVTILALAIGIKMLSPHINIHHKSPTHKPKETSEREKTDTKEKSPEEGSDLLVSIGYGAVFFVIHAILGEVSVISRFTVKGFPDTGPPPTPWSGLVLVMITAGLFLSMFTNISKSIVWSVFGLISSMGLMFLDRWYAFACGAGLALYIMSVWPTICEKMVNTKNRGKSLVIGNAVYLSGVFGMVWCTAYNFVPFGGELARERTYVIVAVMMVFVGLAACLPNECEKSLCLALALPIKRFYLQARLQEQPQIEKPEEQNFGRLVRKFLIGLALVGLMGFEYRNVVWPKYNVLQPLGREKIQDKEFSALIWTFHFGYDNRGWPSLERAAEILNNTQADVITLLESDASKPYLGNNDIAMWLGERLGMYSDFGPSTRDHTWGNLLLSKYPIVKSQHHLLPSPHGELAPAISATVNISGNLVDFVVTHMGNDGDNLDRKLQAEELSRLSRTAENPVVFLGYVTSAPGSRDYKQLTGSGKLKDIDPTDKDRWCQYIMYRDLIRLGYARISNGGLSDTELQMARWKIPSSVEESDNGKLTLNPDDVPSSRRFSSSFGELHHGNWYGKGNHYHVGTPKYFVP